MKKEESRKQEELNRKVEKITKACGHWIFERCVRCKERIRKLKERI